MPLIAANVDDSVKAAFADLARRNGMTETALLKRAVGQLLGEAVSDTPATVESRRGAARRQLKFRLWGDELAAAEKLAAADDVTLPGWVAGLVRRSVLHAVPFNPAELAGLRSAVAALGPLGRNLNTVVRYWHQTGKLDTEAVGAARLAKVIAELRKQVLELVDRASTRYAPPESGESNL